MDKFVPIHGLHHWAYRCRDAEETRRFYEDLLGLPLTHFIRIVRAVMLKGSGLADLNYDALALAGLTLFAMTIAVTRFRRTLD